MDKISFGKLNRSSTHKKVALPYFVQEMLWLHRISAKMLTYKHLCPVNDPDSNKLFHIILRAARYNSVLHANSSLGLSSVAESYDSV